MRGRRTRTRKPPAWLDRLPGIGALSLLLGLINLGLIIAGASPGHMVATSFAACIFGAGVGCTLSWRLERGLWMLAWFLGVGVFSLGLFLAVFGVRDLVAGKTAPLATSVDVGAAMLVFLATGWTLCCMGLWNWRLTRGPGDSGNGLAGTHVPNPPRPPAPTLVAHAVPEMTGSAASD